jgi:phosphatidate phosphatase APP1
VDLPVGNYTLPVRYDGNGTYNATNTTTVDIEVLPRTSEITAEVLNITAGNVTINATVVDAETKQPVPNGPVVAKVNGTVVGTGEVVDGVAVIPTSLDKIGDYPVELEYLGNENYTASNTTIPVDVVGRVSDITADAGNRTLGNSTVNVTLVDPDTEEPIPFAPVIITLPDGTQVTGTTDENGVVEVPVDLPVGPNTLDVFYPGNETYSPSTTTVDMDILPRASEITAEVLNNTAGNVTIKATVVDAETGEIVPNGPVEVYMNGTLVGTGEVVDGITIIKTNITELGECLLDVKYLGNTNYTPSDAILNDTIITHPTQIEPEVLNPVIGETTISIELVDPLTGDKLVNKPVTIMLPDGSTIDTTTNDEGKVILPVDLPAGPNNLTIIFAGDEEYNPSTTPFVVNVTKRNATLKSIIKSIDDGKAQLGIEARDAKTGDLITSGVIELTLPDGTKVTAPLNSEGIATFNDVDAPLGSTDYSATLLENPVYNSADTSVIINNTHPTKPEPEVKDPVIGETEIVIKLVDPETGDILANKPITVVLPDGSTMDITTNDEGIAVIEPDLPAGPNNLTIIFDGDDEYEASTTPFVVNVAKRNATLEPSVSNITGGKAVVEIVAKDEKTGDLITSGEIELTLPDGTKVTAPLNSEGIATFYDVAVPIGSTNYTIKLLENPVYNEADINMTVNYKPRIIIGEWKLVCYNETTNVTPHNVTPGPVKPVKPGNVIKNNVPANKAQFNRGVKAYNKYQNRNARYKPNAYNRYDKRSRDKHPVKPVVPVTMVKYKLLITLYAEYFTGELSYDDFVAILKINGIEIASVSNWDSNGQIVLEYDNLDDVPDFIEIHDNAGHVQDYSNSINKNNAPDSNGEIDSGYIEVEYSSPTHSSSSSNSANSAQGGSSSQASSSNGAGSAQSASVAEG